MRRTSGARARTAVCSLGLALAAQFAVGCTSEGSNLGAIEDPEPTTTSERPSRSPSSTAAPNTTSRRQTTTAPESTAPSVGTLFTDPQGTYTIEIGDDWVEQSGTLVREIEAWLVAPASEGFAPNVNVLTQDTGGMDLDGYLDFSVENMGTLELITADIIRGTNGNDIGIIEYEGVIAGTGAGTLHFLATIDVSDGQAVVATLTASEATFADLRAAVEPYLLTLQAT